MKTLANDQSGSLVDKFFAFPRLEKYRKATDTTDFFDNHPALPAPDLTKQREFLCKPENSKTEIEKHIKCHWGCNRKGQPKLPHHHWSGTDARTRARTLGPKYEQFYVEAYSWLSWYVHPGATGYEGFDENGLRAVFVMAHVLAHELFLEATLICADEFKLTQLDNLKAPIREIIEELRMHPGTVLLQKDIDKLKQLSQQDSKDC